MLPHQRLTQLLAEDCVPSPVPSPVSEVTHQGTLCLSLLLAPLPPSHLLSPPPTGPLGLQPSVWAHKFNRLVCVHTPVG